MRMEDATPGEATGASPGEIEVMTPDDGVPVPDGESSALGDGAPALGEDTPAPVDNAPAVVVDDLASSRRRLSLSRMCSRWRSTSATVSFSGVLPWISARCRFVSETVASTGVLLLLFSMHLFLATK